MTKFQRIIAISTVFLATACGGSNVIDQAKGAYLPECPGQSLGKIVNGYFISGFDSKTLWSAYATDQDNVVRITAEGDILYVGVQTNASLTLLYNTDRDELDLQGVRFGQEDQPRGLATALISNMCDEAKGL